MTLTKETAKILGSKGGRARQDNIEELMLFVVGGGAREVKRIIEDLLKGTKVTQEEKEGVEYFLKLLPYKKARLANLEVTGKDGKDLFPKPIMDVSENNGN